MISVAVQSIRTRFFDPAAFRRVAPPIAWITYIAVPAAGWGLLNGVPLGPLEAVAISLVCWAWAGNPQLPGVRVAVVLALAKVLLAGVFVDRGFVASYYANDNWAAPAARSVEFRNEAFSRRDERLAFGAKGQPDLPLHFFNDLRFNYYLPSQPRRDRLAYSVEWNGFVQSRNPSSPATFYLAAGDGISAELSIDSHSVIAPGGTPPRSQSLTLPAGWHALRIRLAAPYGATRRVEAGEIVESAGCPFDGNRVLVNPASFGRLAIDTVLRRGTRVLDTLMLLWLGLIVIRRLLAWRDARVTSLLWIGAIVEALLFARAYADRVTVLSGGNDWLTYEYFAREIALGDWLLEATTLGNPFYYQPLYPYFVALTHLGFGDSLFGVVLVQRLLLVATIGWVMLTTARLFGSVAGWVALIGGGLFLYAQGGRWSDVLLAEPLFMPLLVAWVWLLVRIATEPPRWSLVLLAGAVGGIATLTRSTLLLGWLLVLPVWWAALRVCRFRRMAVLLTVMVTVVGMARFGTGSSPERSCR